jgi:NADH-quinone oxidoreductase subunit M
MIIQIDSKVVVAFSTTVQMNFILFLIFSFGTFSNQVLALALVNHMLTASLLFFITDCVLIRFNTREFFFLSGLYGKLPVFSFFLLFSLVNQINFPGFLGFVLDVSFLSVVFPANTGSSFMLFFFLFNIEHMYILFFFLKIAFGISNNLKYVIFKDLALNEVLLFLYLISISLIWGVYPLNFSFLILFVSFYKKLFIQ